MELMMEIRRRVMEIMAGGGNLQTVTVTIDSECTNGKQINDKIQAVVGNTCTYIAVRDLGATDLEMNTAFALQWHYYDSISYSNNNLVRWRGNGYQTVAIASNYDAIAHVGDTYTVYKIMVDF